jgi:hypothetical protein
MSSSESVASTSAAAAATIAIPFNGFPTTSYETLDEATKVATNVAINNGFALNITQTTKQPSTGEPKLRYLACSKAGIKQQKGYGIRETSSKQTGCIYHVAIRRVSQGYGSGAYIWRIDGDVKNHNVYNHMLEKGREEMRGDVAARRLTTDEKHQIDNMYDVQISTQQMLLTLKAKNPSTLASK